jgi:hypothetical protein
MGFKFNALTGKFDLVGSGSTSNADDILTHRANQFGHVLMFFDPVLSVYYEADDLIVTDNEGNVVTK